MHKSDNKLKVADDEPAIQVLASDNLEEDYDESPQDYAGDQFPAHLKTSKLRYLSKLGSHVPVGLPVRLGFGKSVTQTAHR